MHRSRIVVVALAMVLAGVTLPADAGASARPAGVDQYQLINRPNAKYVGSTCVFDLSGFDDFEEVTHLEDCGITIDFDVEMLKRTTGSTWGTWGSPPDTETATPLVLHRLSDPTTVTITLSKKAMIFGFEAQPQPFSRHDITATFYNGRGVAKATYTRSIEGEAGARLLAAKGRHGGSLKTIVITSDTHYAIAQLRVRLAK